MHSRRIIDAITDKTDDVSHFFQREYDSFFLIGIHFDEQIGPFRCLPKSFIMELVEFGPCENSVGAHAYKACQVLRDEFVVTGNEFDGYPEPCQVANGLRRAFLGPIEKRDESDKGHVVLVISGTRGRIMHRPYGNGDHSNSLPAPI